METNSETLHIPQMWTWIVSVVRDRITVRRPKKKNGKTLELYSNLEAMTVTQDTFIEIELEIKRRIIEL